MANRKITDEDLANYNKKDIQILLNDEKELQAKKKKLSESIAKKPTTIVSQVQNYILQEKVFTLTQLRFISK